VSLVSFARRLARLLLVALLAAGCAMPTAGARGKATGATATKAFMPSSSASATVVRPVTATLRPTSTPVPVQTPATYTVQSGDTLGAIAAVYGVSVEALAAANSIADPSRISIGQVLVIPKAGQAPAATPVQVAATMTAAGAPAPTATP
jgi:LysM repeat protein